MNNIEVTLRQVPGSINTYTVSSGTTLGEVCRIAEVSVQGKTFTINGRSVDMTSPLTSNVTVTVTAGSKSA